MNKKSLLLLFLVPTLAFSGADDLRIEQRNSTDTATIVRTMPNTAPNDSILYYNGSTLLPGMATLGSGLSITSGVLNVTVSGQVNSDWNATSGVSKILNKPTISTVGMTGLYADLLGSPALAAVATSGSYNDLSNKPTIPSAQVNSDWNASSGVAQILNKPSLSTVATTGAYSDLSGKPTLGTAAALNVPSSGDAASSEVVKGNDSRLTNATANSRSAISLTTSGTSGAATYNSTTGVLNVPNYANSGGTVTSITAGTGLSGGTITTSGTISLPNTGTSGTYSSITTDAQGRVTAGTTRSFSYTTRSLNTCFQVSSTRDAIVAYSVDIATSLTLSTGQQGTVYLRVYSNNACSTGTQEITRFVNGNTGTLTIGLSLTQNVTGTLTGVIPAGSYVQLVTENNTGTPTFTARPGQEVLM